MKTIRKELNGEIRFDGEWYSVIDDKGELIADYNNLVEADLHLDTLGTEDEYHANYQECGHDLISQD